jgi:hypothetical protein
MLPPVAQAPGDLDPIEKVAGSARLPVSRESFILLT